MDINQKKQMQWYMFFTFLFLFVTVSALTIMALFFGVGQLEDKYKDNLTWAFVLEVGVAVLALFYSVFDLKTSKSLGSIDDLQQSSIQSDIERMSFTTKEKRILRALIDEPRGRLIKNYTVHYKKELDTLIGENMVTKLNDERYKLTTQGMDAALTYMSRYLGNNRKPNINTP